MAQQTLTQVGAFTQNTADAANANFSDLYAAYGTAVSGSAFATNYYVDGDLGVDTNTGLSPTSALKTIQAAVTAAGAGSRIFIKPRAVAAGGTDPVNYAETIIIPPGKSGLWLIGTGGGPAQGNQPQIKIGAGSTAMITVRSPGCVITGLSINGGSSTGGGILLDDDGSTKSAFGTIISNCFFKNCVVTAHDSRAGGAIYWASGGGAWQVNIVGNQFYDNVGGISLTGTSNDRPKDIVISGNLFNASASSTVDSYIYGAGGSGFNDVTITHNVFASAKPSISSGNIALYVDLTGVASGIFSHNMIASASGTFGATGNAGKVPTTVLIAGNYIESGLLART